MEDYFPAFTATESLLPQAKIPEPSGQGLVEYEIYCKPSGQGVNDFFDNRLKTIPFSFYM